MSKKLPHRLLALSVCLILLLSACTSKENTPGAPSSDSNVLTWTRWNGSDDFLELASQTYPEIEWEYTASGWIRAGHNTGCSRVHRHAGAYFGNGEPQFQTHPVGQPG